MARLTRKLVFTGLTLCAVLVGIFWTLRGDWLQAVLAGITLAIGILPNEQPVILIVFLARRTAAGSTAGADAAAQRHRDAGPDRCAVRGQDRFPTQNRLAVAALRIVGDDLNVQDHRADSAVICAKDLPPPPVG